MPENRINPSAPGWIEKFFHLQPTVELPFADISTYYLAIRKSGFIYGHVLYFLSEKKIDHSQWIDEERSKLALLTALYRLYIQYEPEFDKLKFFQSVIGFYNQMNPKGFDFLSKMMPKSEPSEELEKIIGDRVRTNDNILSKNFSHIVTNALLFLDILAFNRFLIKGHLSISYIKKSEELIISVVSIALNIKSQKSTYDDLLVKLFNASLRYGKYSDFTNRIPETLPLDFFEYDLEKYYLIDLAGMALWSDGWIEDVETKFLLELGEAIKVQPKFVRDAILDTSEFIQRHKNKIAYFQYSNPVKHFYDNMSESVVVLIKRNKSRLAREISQSGELVKLLALSAQRDLTVSEKKKVKNQLLDICKSIPSLTIFLLPGGSLLLPILIKFIPQLLPSAFNENKERNE